MLDASGCIPIRDYSDAEEMKAAARERHARFFPAKPIVRLVERKATKVAAALPAPVQIQAPAPAEPAGPVVLPEFLSLRGASEPQEIPLTSKNKARLIIGDVAQETGITVHDIMSECRQEKVARARQTAMWLCARDTLLSYPSIGKLFSDRDHTTVINAVRVINGLRGENVRNAGAIIRKSKEERARAYLVGRAKRHQKRVNGKFVRSEA